jgi:uncharacterized integral membrane protein
MKAKVIVFMILIVLFTFFVSQNTEIVEINAFFWKFQMSKIVLISLTGLVGLILGFILASIFNKQKKTEKIKKETAKEMKQNNLPDDTKTKTNL